MRPPIRFTVAIDFLPIEIATSDGARLRSQAFLDAAKRYYGERFGEGTVEVEPLPDGLAVTWMPAEAQADPFEYAVELLKKGQHPLAVPILEALLKADPRNTGILFNLGMAESDLGRLDEARTHLRVLVAEEPRHAHGWVALGVAEARAGQVDDAIATLEHAVSIAPDDPYAQRNLGGLLAKRGNLADAETHLREAVRLAPRDPQALYGLAHTLLAGDGAGGADVATEADELLERAIAADPHSELAEHCRAERGRIAHRTFRANAGGGLRMDAVMYCLGALRTFAKMPQDEVRNITLEIAMLGTRGIEVNDPAQKYELRSLPGHFSGLHLLCIEYVGFKLIDPNVDLGFDLAEEFRQAKALFNAGGSEQG